MGLFGFGKKDKKPTCACQSNCQTAQVKDVENIASSNAVIKVLGTGCQSCHTLLENTKTAVNNMNISAKVEYVQDMAQIAGYGVMILPALVITEKPVVMGKVLKVSEVQEILKKSGFLRSK